MFFYIYTAITGSEILLLDVISYVIGAVICQIISYKILTIRKLLKALNTAGVIFLIAHAVILAVFTFLTPKLPIFRESHSGRYGTTWKVERHEEHDSH